MSGQLPYFKAAKTVGEAESGAGISLGVVYRAGEKERDGTRGDGALIFLIAESKWKLVRWTERKICCDS